MMTALMTAVPAVAQGLSDLIDSTFAEYHKATKELDPSQWTGNQFFHWSLRFQDLSDHLDASVPQGRRDAVRSTHFALLMANKQFRDARELAMKGMRDQSTCAGGARWGNFALSVELAESRQARKDPDPQVVLPIVADALLGCPNLDELVRDPDAFVYAVVLYHAAACCEPDLKVRADELCKIEHVARQVRGADLRTDRFFLLVDAAKAYCVAGEYAAAIAACNRAEVDTESRTAEAALSTVLADKTIGFASRLELVRASFIDGKIDIAGVNHLGRLLSEVQRFRDKPHATTAVEIIDLILLADLSVLQQANDALVADRVKSVGASPATSAEMRPFECSMLTTRWILNRSVVNNQGATNHDAMTLLREFPDHPLRDQIMRSIR
jgi:hypothetical protein